MNSWQIQRRFLRKRLNVVNLWKCKNCNIAIIGTQLKENQIQLSTSRHISTIESVSNFSKIIESKQHVRLLCLKDDVAINLDILTEKRLIQSGVFEYHCYKLHVKALLVIHLRLNKLC